MINRHIGQISLVALMAASAAHNANAQTALPDINIGKARKPVVSRAAARASKPTPHRVAAAPSAPAPAPQSAVEVAEKKYDATQEASSSTFTTGQKINSIPFSRPGEALEDAIPGLLVTQHSGEGKANQYQLRGFQLDHGTDFAIDIDGVPLNMPTHGHGQGYADANFLIPELFSWVEGRKGPYYADEGDFSAAGAAHIHYKDELPGGLLSMTVGSWDYGRLLAVTSNKLSGGNLLAAGELSIYNGPWTVPDEGHRFNGFMRWSQGTYDNGISFDGQAYGIRWHSSNQIPERAVTEGVIPLYGNINPSDRGDTTRFSLSGRWAQSDAKSHTSIMAFVMHNTLDLYNDFDYYLSQPLLGDQFRQFDRRTVLGLKAEQGWNYRFLDFPVETRVGVQSRYDNIRVGIQDTYFKMAFQTLTNDHVDEGNFGVWTDTTVHWAPWLRTTAGIRVDYFAASVQDIQNPLESPWITGGTAIPLGLPSFYTTSPGTTLIWTGPANSGSKTAAMDSPKLSIVLGPWEKTEFFINAGEGFHSVDARATVTTLNPSDGSFASKEPLLVKARGVEVGARTKFIDGLDTSLTLFGLNFDSESQFDGDTGTTLFGRPSRRYGIELTNHYSPYSWLHFGGDMTLNHARSRGWDVPQTVAYAMLVTPGSVGYASYIGNAPGNYIPEGPPIISSVDMEIGEKTGWFGAIKFRFKGVYPVTEDGAIHAPATGWLDARLGYRWENGLKLQLDGFNILNSRSDQITYGYGSLLPSDPLFAQCQNGNASAVVCATGQMDRHFKPIEPLAGRLTLTGPLTTSAFDPLFATNANAHTPVRDFWAIAQRLAEPPEPDGYDGLPNHKGPLAPPPPLWTGFYLGATTGVTFGANNNVYYASIPTVPGVDPAAAVLGTGTLGNSNAGFIGGGQVGYNFQLSPRAVVGIEADFQGVLGGSGASATPYAVPSYSTPGNILLGNYASDERLDSLGTARVRLGYLFTPRMLLFTTAGLAYGQVDFKTNSEVLNASPAAAIANLSGGAASYSQMRVGYSVGGGFEWMFHPNWSFKAEYLYYNLGTFDVAMPQATINVAGGAASGNLSTTFHARSDGQVVRAGLNYHFNWATPTPIVAKF